MDDKEFQKPRFDIFEAEADKLEKLTESPKSPDDPKWLKRNASQFRAIARKSERGFEHKLNQRRKKRREAE